MYLYFNLHHRHQQTISVDVTKFQNFISILTVLSNGVNNARRSKICPSGRQWSWFKA